MDLHVETCKSLGMKKCPRCRIYSYSDLNYHYLCNRCMAVIVNDYPDDPSVPHIMKNLNERGLNMKDNPEL